MSQLTIYAEQTPEQVLETSQEFTTIAAKLKVIGVEFSRWQASVPIGIHDTQAQILDAYAPSITALKQAGGYTTADVVSLHPQHPDRASLRAKFLSEHTHSDDEVRFFVRGRGLFCISANELVFAVMCEQGDLITVPAGLTHWFDMGSAPEFTCIRLFTRPEGWVATFTGRDIAAHIPAMA